MWRNVRTRIDQADLVTPMLMVMILAGGALVKTGHAGWGLAWVAGLCPVLILMDLLHFHRGNRTAAGA